MVRAQPVGQILEASSYLMGLHLLTMFQRNIQNRVSTPSRARVEQSAVLSVPQAVLFWYIVQAIPAGWTWGFSTGLTGQSLSCGTGHTGV